MRFLSFLMLSFLLLGLQLPKISMSQAQVELKLVPELYAGSASTVEQPIPSQNLQEKPNYGKIWKEKFNALNPFRKHSDDDLVAALLAFFLGQWGAHKFYQGNKAGGFTMLGITLGGLALYIAGYVLGFLAIASGSVSTFPVGAAILFGLGILCLAVTSIWAFVDFIRILIDM